MIGFDAIGQSAIASQSSDAADVIVYAPVAAAVAVTTAVPVVRGGASVAPTACAVTVTVPVASVLAGSLVTVPVASVTVTSAAAAVQISATVTAPTPPAVTVAAAVPLVGAGAIVQAPAAIAVTITAPVAFVTAGKSVAPSSAAVTVTTPAAAVQISATVTVPALTVAVASDPAQILGGNYIEASNTITHTTTLGEIGSSSIGEFAIGEGEPETHTHKRGIFVLVSTTPPFITAGKSVFLPAAANINVTSARAEIASRGRKIRVLAIAS
jgi:hypothetical protein